MLPDLSGIDKRFHYAVPDRLQGAIAVGSIVRIRLRHRRVRGVVVALGARPESGPRPPELLEIDDTVSIGPSPEVVALAEWAAWRYAGRLRPFLVAASPPRIVRSLPPPAGPPAAPASPPAPPVAPPPPAGPPVAPPPPAGPPVAPPPPAGPPVAPPPPAGPPVAPPPPPPELHDVLTAALASPVSVLRLPPAWPRLPLVTALAGRLGPSGLLVVVPERRDAERLHRQLERAGVPAALLPEQWDRAAGGGRAVVGSRAAAFGPLPELRAAVVLDAHDEALTEQRAPTWSAPVVLVERARRAGAPLLLVSPCPTLDLDSMGAPVRFERNVERGGWPVVEVLDRRGDDPRSGRYSAQLAPIIAKALSEAPELPVVAVWNRTGRTRLLACAACGELARCELCGSSVSEPGTAGTRRRSEAKGGATAPLHCSACGAQRPPLCAACGSSILRRLRVGSAGAAEELAALTGREVTEVSGPARHAEPVPERGLLVGTEAVLHRVRRASLVAFLDLDAELLAPRLRAGEQAMALLARAARLVHGRAGARSAERAARLLLQTRLPEHEVVRAAVLGDPGLVIEAERGRRLRLRLPPFASLALVEGPDAAELGRRLREAGLEVGAGPPRSAASGPTVLVRAPGSNALADALAACGSGALDVRVEVDPLGA